MDHENLFLALIAAKDPTVFHVLAYGYATMWFSTPFFAASLALSTLTIVAYRHAPSVRSRALPPYPLPERRSSDASNRFTFPVPAYNASDLEKALKQLQPELERVSQAAVISGRELQMDQQKLQRELERSMRELQRTLELQQKVFDKTELE